MMAEAATDKKVSEEYKLDFSERIKEMNDEREEKSEQNKTKPQIELPKDGILITSCINQIIPHISNKEKLYYRQEEKSIVILDEIKVVNQKNKKILGFRTLTPQEFVTHLEKYTTPGSNIWDNKSRSYYFKNKSLSSECAKIIISSEILKNNLPVIANIFQVPFPFLIDNKIIFPMKGYDGFLLSWMPKDAPEINKEMTLEEAKQTIEFILAEFCFEKPQDKINAIAGLLTPFLRGLYCRNTCRSPIFFYIANRERAGKDYLADITGILYYGEAMSETPLCDYKGSHDEEFRKKVLSNFKMGRNRLHLSNNKGFINSAELEGLSTREVHTDRILGTNQLLTYPNTLEISLSGNAGITYTPDFGNRTIFINLFLELENPNERKFNNKDLHGWIKDNRSKILSALYALVKNWFDKEMPAGSLPFASFPEWARVCGGIMEAAQLGNPCVSNIELISIGGDTETRDMKRLFELCHLYFGEKWVLKKEIVTQLTSVEDFEELFVWIDWQEKGSRNKFGVLFEKFVGRIFSGIKLIRLENSKNERRKYQFKKVGVDGVEGGSPHPIYNFNISPALGGGEPIPSTPSTPPPDIGKEIAQPFETIQPPPPKPQPPTPSEVRQALMTQLNQSDMVERQQFVSQYPEQFQMAVDVLIDKMKEVGDCYEPIGGMLRKL